jgi:ABC-type glycerol-3-phosphate transport system substrate-binding protein
MIKKLMTLAALSAALLVATAAQAAIIYNGGGPNQAGGQTADAATSTPLAAESFNLIPNNNTITDVHWWGFVT